MKELVISIRTTYTDIKSAHRLVRAIKHTLRRKGYKNYLIEHHMNDIESALVPKYSGRKI